MKKRYIRILAIICAILAVAFIRRSQLDRSKLRHALNLRRLPPTTRIVGAGGESWTDYLFVADLTISPDHFDKLLSGRNFSEEKYFPERVESDAYLKLRPLNVSRSWFSSGCLVSANEAKTRAYVRYISD